MTVATSGSDIQLGTVDLPPHLTYYYGEGKPNYIEWDTSRGAEYQPSSGPW